jgi:hypothetical protein
MISFTFFPPVGVDADVVLLAQDDLKGLGLVSSNWGKNDS